MIELDSALIILLIECLAVLLLILIGIFIFNTNRRSREHSAANEMISFLEDTEAAYIKELEDLIRDHCVLGEEALNDVVQDIRKNKSAVHKNVLTIFLKKDISLIKKVEQHINKISAIYCQLLQEPGGQTASSAVDASEIDSQIAQLQHENNILSEQLLTAMQTMDEISAEYTKVFSGTQSDLELENSRKKMLKVFHEAEKILQLSPTGDG